MVDLQNEEVGKASLNSNPVGVEAKEEPPAIEEATEEAEQPELTNEIIDEPKEEPKEEVKEEVKKPVRAQDRIITCPKCNKSMKMKSFRYSHEQNCKGNLAERPVKKHTNPRPKQQPKPKPVKPPPEVYYSDEEEEEQPTQPLIKKKQPPQPINHVSALAQHYQLLQNEFINRKQERYNNLCMNMFSSKTKKR